MIVSSPPTVSVDALHTSYSHCGCHKRVEASLTIAPENGSGAGPSYAQLAAMQYSCTLLRHSKSFNLAEARESSWFRTVSCPADSREKWAPRKKTTAVAPRSKPHAAVSGWWRGCRKTSNLLPHPLRNHHSLPCTCGAREPIVIPRWMWDRQQMHDIVWESSIE